MSLFIRVVATKDIDPVDNPAEDFVGSQSLRKGAGTSIFFFGFFAALGGKITGKANLTNYKRTQTESSV